jgi:alanine racemase
VGLATWGCEGLTEPRVWAEIDVCAIKHNASLLSRLVAPARLGAVVKADGYGHGITVAARGAVAGGATWLAVSFVEEGVALREAGFTQPVLVMTEPREGTWATVIRHRLSATVFTEDAVEAAAKAVVEHDEPIPVRVHLKIDTGFHRLGVPHDALASVARAIAARRELEFEGAWTHFAVGDRPGDSFTDLQSKRFRRAVSAVAGAGCVPRMLHVCNSGAALLRPHDHLDLVRCGAALYGVESDPALRGMADLQPAMSVKTRVYHIQAVPAGDGISYGLQHRFKQPSIVATVPVGYVDGVPRLVGTTGGQVIIGGRLRPIVGVITMDHLMVDCGNDETVRVGDEVVALGSQGAETISAWDLARWAQTNPYEIMCGMRGRIHRRVVGDV